MCRPIRRMDGSITGQSCPQMWFGCTRATMGGVKPGRPRGYVAEVFPTGETPPWQGLCRVKPAMNKEFLVRAGHNPVRTALLLFVHTARRSYRSGLSLSCSGLCQPWPAVSGRPGLPPADVWVTDQLADVWVTDRHWGGPAWKINAVCRTPC